MSSHPASAPARAGGGSFPLTGRVAIVTGGGSGIGLACVEALAAAGAHVVAADPREPAALPPGATHRAADVTRAEDVAALEASTRAALGPCDLLVLSAGIGLHERLAEGDPEKWARLLDTNVVGALRVIRACVPAMLEAGRGDVVVVTSVAARQAYAWGGVYGASKAALEAIAEALRLEVSPAVRVTTVAPGVVDTPFFSRVAGGPTPESIGWGALAASDVADAVCYAVTRPPGVALNHITLRPVAQPF